MNENQSQGLQKRIDFFGRWAFAFFTTHLVLLGWLGTNIRVEQYDIVFKAGVGGAVFSASVSIFFAVIAYRDIKRLEASNHERN